MALLVLLTWSLAAEVCLCPSPCDLLEGVGGTPAIHTEGPVSLWGGPCGLALSSLEPWESSLVFRWDPV